MTTPLEYYRICRHERKQSPVDAYLSVMYVFGYWSKTMNWEVRYSRLMEYMNKRIISLEVLHHD